MKFHLQHTHRNTTQTRAPKEFQFVLPSCGGSRRLRVDGCLLRQSQVRASLRCQHARPCGKISQMLDESRAMTRDVQPNTFFLLQSNGKVHMFDARAQQKVKTLPGTVGGYRGGKSTASRLVARHLSSWAKYNGKCFPVSGTELQPFQQFLALLTDCVYDILRSDFPEFAAALKVCEENIPPQYRCDPSSPVCSLKFLLGSAHFRPEHSIWVTVDLTSTVRTRTHRRTQCAWSPPLRSNRFRSALDFGDVPLQESAPLDMEGADVYECVF